MSKGKRWMSVVAMLAMVLLVAGCESNSPTAPSTPSGQPTPPPTGASVTISVSNSRPLVNSTSTISVTVSENGAAAPNGTAVELVTDLGVFVDTALSTTIRTTTNGVATAILTSSQTGVASITVRVNNIVQGTSVTFVEQQTQPGEPVPTITSITPAVGSPDGGELVTIRGTNFDGPLRVLFGDIEAPVASSTTTEIRVVSPTIQLTIAEQFREVTVTVITEAGSPGEQSVTSTQVYRYELEVLTPKVLHVSPSSGPNEGNTRVTIFGEGFQSPAAVYFGTVEATVIQVTFDQIVAMTPPAAGIGAELQNSLTSVRVKNIASGTESTLGSAFRYGPTMLITNVAPTEGPADGGTRVTINGFGFDDPVAVTIGGIAAQPIRVSGTEVVVVTGAPRIDGCADVSGAISVTNIESGESADGGTFTYVLPKPAVTGVSPSSQDPGGTVTVSVVNPGTGNVRITVDDSVRLPTSTTVFTSRTDFRISLPTAFEFAEEECGIAGMMFVPTLVAIGFENVTTGCTDDLPDALEVTPPDDSCREAPAPTATPAALVFPSTTFTTSSAEMFFSVGNAGGGTVSVLSATSSSPGVFSITTSPTFPVSLGAGDSTTFGITFTPSAAAMSFTGTITVATSGDPLTVAVSGTSP